MDITYQGPAERILMEGWACCPTPAYSPSCLATAKMGVLNAVRTSRLSASSWWLRHQPVSIQRYFAAAVLTAIAGSVLLLVFVEPLRSFNVAGVAVFCVLGIGVSIATRSVMVAFPGDGAGQDMVGVWLMAAVILWGPAEATVVAIVIGGIWTHFLDTQWGGSHRHPAQTVLNVTAMVISIDVAFLTLEVVGWWPLALGQVVAVILFLTVNAAVILGVVHLAGSGGELDSLRSWSTRVMLLTEATLSIGMAAAWQTEPAAGVLLSGTLVAAGAGLHYAHLLEEASTDRRTGLLRPDTWTSTVARVVSREPVGIILADLDYFKQVNDELGHLAGDEVLAAVGGTIADSLRPGDVAGRWGGEEFVVALPGLDAAEAREVAERLAEAVRSAPYASAGLSIRCTLSAGVAHVPATTPEEAAAAVRQALREADVAMYAAKRAGRDRVVAYSELPGSDRELMSKVSRDTTSQG
jgi:diguanylate cyclase